MTCESSGMISSTRVLGNRLLLLLVLLSFASKWFTMLNCLDIQEKGIEKGANSSLVRFPNSLALEVSWDHVEMSGHSRMGIASKVQGQVSP